VHGDNPHIWTDPRITQAIVHMILPDLQRIVPDSAQVFQDRADAYIQGLNDLYRDIGLKLEPMDGMQVIAQTPGLDYFFSAFFINRVEVIVEHPGGEPSARHMTELSDLLKEGGITAIIQLPQFSERLPKTLSQESGVPMTTMSPLINGVEYVETYLDLMWYNADQLCLLAPPEA
jgi:ABC-type Zn uptake system ZnuABC Zn-binding protein ZnuA